MALPFLHDTDYSVDDLISLTEIAGLPRAPRHDALRSYACHRREWLQRGPMPKPVCRLGRSRLWLRADIEHWLRNLAAERLREHYRSEALKAYRSTAEIAAAMLHLPPPDSMA